MFLNSGFLEFDRTRFDPKFSSKGTGGGCYQGVASIAVFNACLAARSRVLNTIESDPTKLVAYCSDQVRL